MARISGRLRQQVTERAQELCEYCQTAQIVVVTMEIDHILPEISGGKTEADNLCLTCRGCNSYKKARQTGIDPETGNVVSLFHPRIQQWNDHFEWREDGILIIGKTATGRATINQLRMNRENILISRSLWVQSGWHPPQLGKFPLT